MGNFLGDFLKPIELPPCSPDWYMGDLLTLAHDLADRLLVAFATENGIPHPRVNLLHGVPEDGLKESCTAGIGSLILELGMLSREAIR